NRIAKSNFIRRCKKFEIDENNILYVSRNNTMERRRVVPKYDEELLNLILVRFHDQANHRNYHKTCSAISEKHIGITQEEVQAYISQCPACAINTSIKEKTDMIPVVSTITTCVRTFRAATVATHLCQRHIQIISKVIMAKSS